MKVWVTASMTDSEVELWLKRPDTFIRSLSYVGGDHESLSRIGMKKFLKGFKQILPSYGSKTILELDLVVRDDEGPQDGFSR